MSGNIGVRIHFSAGHRILNLTGPGAKCRNPHGHTFFATFVFEQDEQWPPVVEFGAVKSVLRDCIKEKYDHGFFVDRADKTMCAFLESENAKHCKFNGPPTTERIVARLAADAEELIPGANLVRVMLEEGPENFATYEAT